MKTAKHTNTPLANVSLAFQINLFLFLCMSKDGQLMCRMSKDGQLICRMSKDGQLMCRMSKDDAVSAHYLLVRYTVCTTSRC